MDRISSQLDNTGISGTVLSLRGVYRRSSWAGKSASNSSCSGTAILQERNRRRVSRHQSCDSLIRSDCVNRRRRGSNGSHDGSIFSSLRRRGSNDPQQSKFIRRRSSDGSSPIRSNSFNFKKKILYAMDGDHVVSEKWSDFHKNYHSDTYKFSAKNMDAIKKVRTNQYSQDLIQSSNNAFYNKNARGGSLVEGSSAIRVGSMGQSSARKQSTGGSKTSNRGRRFSM